MSFKYWVCISFGLFVIGLAVGLIVSKMMPAGIVSVISENMASLEQLGEMLAPFQGTTAAFIFVKNTSVLLFGFIFSPILCLLPLITLFFNGVLLSFVVSVIAGEASLVLVLTGILPHGIFEIPAIIIGEAAALNLGFSVIVSIFYPDKRANLVPVTKHSLRYLVIALILLVPAAIIETFVTPLLMQHYLP